MNGRVYDPKIGRFMSPDPSDALHPGVGFNRYAYVLNNPVSLTDPSGFHNHHPGVGDEDEDDAPSGLRDTEQKIEDRLDPYRQVFRNDLDPKRSVPAQDPFAQFVDFVRQSFSPNSEVRLIKIGGLELIQQPNPNAKNVAVNLDSSTARALTAEGSPHVLSISLAIGDRAIIMSEMAFAEFMSAVTRLAGPKEKMRVARFLSVLSVVPNHPSDRVMALKHTKAIEMPDKIIFGTGDYLGLTTFTSDGRFVRAALAQGVILDVYEHPPYSFMGQ